MPTPSSSLATLRPDLGGSMEEFNLMADRAGFIGLRVMPVIESAKQAGSFGIIPIEELLKNADTERSPGSGYKRGTWKFTSTTFATKEHGFEVPVDDRESEMYAEYFQAELVSAELALDIVLRNFERRIAALVFNTSTFSPTAVGIEWSTSATAVPITDVEAAVRRVYTASGMWPDTMIMDRIVFRNLRNCAQVIERIHASGAGDRVRPADITAAQLAAVFDLPNIIVAGGTKNTAKEGQSAALEQIWDDEYCMICRLAPPGASVKVPGLGRTIHWGADGSQIGTAMETYRDETVRGDVVRARMDTDEKIFYPEAGDLLSNITA